MRLGVDYSTRAADWPAFARALVCSGRTFVGRYLAYDTSRIRSDRRALTIGEAEALAAAEIDIFCWWENSPTHVASRTERRATEGRAAGEEDAILAAAMMQYFGQPEAPIYFTVDADVRPEQVTAYFEGARSVVGLARMGSYGGYAVTKWLLDKQLVRFACQTEAWSRFDSAGRLSGAGNLTWDPRAQLRQWTTTKPGYPGRVGGLDCDGLEARALDFGQWRYGEGEEMTGEQYEILRSSSAKNGYRAAIGAALAIGWYEEAKRLNDEFYVRWPRADPAGNIINSSGLPVDWAPPEHL